MEREKLIKNFYDWSQKRENYKKGYKGILTIKNLKKWDDQFFNSKLFDLNGRTLDVFIKETYNLLYSNKDAEWLKANDNISNGAPQAIFGRENYLKFLKTLDPKSDTVDSESFSFPDRNYFALWTKDTSITELLNVSKGNDFWFTGAYTKRKETRVGDIIFFVQKGEETKISWQRGLSAICEITDIREDKNNKTTSAGTKYFDIKLKTLLILPNPLEKHDFKDYKELKDIVHIARTHLKDPDQVNWLFSDVNLARHLVGAITNIYPEIEKELTDIFGKDFAISSLNITNGSNTYTHIYKIDKKIVPNKVENESHNLIVYGAPGTGKSYGLNIRVNSNFPHEILRTRITFHPNYNYRNFVGTYKPSPLYKDSEIAIFSSKETSKEEKKREPIIDYIFEAGPFIRSYLKAYHNPNHNFVLIIEELNRANAPAVFGELFQLLDREDDGRSSYSVRLEESAMKYLRENGVKEDEIRMPQNLYIWSTMNNADQGVLPLDAAFKRRWSFEHIGLNDNEGSVEGQNIVFKFIPDGKQLKWNKFRRELNDFLVDTLKIHEDKLIAPFFLSSNELMDENAIKNKLLLYLKEDVLKYKDGLFNYKTFSQISQAYNERKVIFMEDFEIEKFYTDKSTDTE